MEGTVSIIKEEVVKTVVGTSLEGQIATGYKLFICGDIDYKIQYTTAKDVQTIHKIEPFGAYVTLPKDFRNHSYATASVVVEDISVKKINSRCIYSNITMLLVAYTDC